MTPNEKERRIVLETTCYSPFYTLNRYLMNYESKGAKGI